MLQKTAIRIITKMKFRESCREQFKALSILPLSSLYILDTLLFFMSRYSFERHESLNNQYNTRSKNSIPPNYHRLKIYDTLPVEAGRKLYNKLPDNIKSNCSKLFKTNLKKYLLKHSFYNINEFMDAYRTYYNN